MYLVARALVVGVLGRFVVGGYLHALNLVSLVRALLVRVLVGSGYLHSLELVPWWFVLVGSGYLHALNLVPCWLVCPWLVLVGSYLHTLELVSCWLVSLVGSWLAVTCIPWSLCPAGWCAW